MNIRQVITGVNYPVRPTDTVRYALEKMADLRLTHLPIVKNKMFLGSVSYEALAYQTDAERQIEQAVQVFQHIHLFDTQHIFDAVLFFQLYQVDLLTVVDEQYTYVGATTPLALINTLSQAMSINQPGGIIVLEMGYRDNALSHIAHIVEADNAQILNSYVRTFSDSARLEVTIKINKSNISSIVSSFLRHDYTVKATYNDESSHDNSRDRYEQLMNYLNM